MERKSADIALARLVRSDTFEARSSMLSGSGLLCSFGDKDRSSLPECTLEGKVWYEREDSGEPRFELTESCARCQLLWPAKV